METERSNTPRRPGWDALVVGVLTFAHLQILAFGEMSIPLDMRLNDILRHPILGNLLPTAGEEAMGPIGPSPTDPIGLLLHTITIGIALLYLVADLLPGTHVRGKLKWIVLTLLITTALFLPTTKLMLLRDISGPASYTHDGGVIQTEATIEYILAGKNPYVEDYVDTPMGEWGFSEFRTALYHYPYLPWTFIFSAPFYLIGQAFGFYDQRIVYLLLMAAALVLLPRLATSQRSKLALVAVVALNPIMAIDIIFGKNDSFVLCWIIFSLVCYQQWWRYASEDRASEDRASEDQASEDRASSEPAINAAQRKIIGQRWLIASSILFGIACASKPTAWFFAPFYGLLLVRGELIDLNIDQVSRGATARLVSVRNHWVALLRNIPTIIRRAGPALAIFGLVLVPFVLWDPFAMYDDVWRWSNGRGETGYQIWGWGLSNFVLAAGLVEDRFGQWPFWILQAAIAGPLLLWTIYRQLRENTISAACWHYGVLLLGFFYASRFLNDNYLGYIIAFLAIGLLSNESEAERNSIISS